MQLALSEPHLKQRRFAGRAAFIGWCSGPGNAGELEVSPAVVKWQAQNNPRLHVVDVGHW